MNTASKSTTQIVLPCIGDKELQQKISSKENGTVGDKVEAEIAKLCVENDIAIAEFAKKHKDETGNTIYEVDILTTKNDLIECKNKLNSYNSKAIIDRIGNFLKHVQPQPRRIIYFSKKPIDESTKSIKEIRSYCKEKKILVDLIDSKEALLTLIK